MKITFSIENGSSQLILTPENPRDKTCLGLCMDGKNEIKFKHTTTDCMILEFLEGPTEGKSLDPKGYKLGLTEVKLDSYDRCLCGGVGCNSCEPQGRG